jgi:hypothetical protein
MESFEESFKEIDTLEELGEFLFKSYNHYVPKENMSEKLIARLIDNSKITYDSSGQGGSTYCTGIVELGDYVANFSYVIFDPADWTDPFTYGIKTDSVKLKIK